MLSFIKKLFGAKPAVESTAPYKVEAPAETQTTVGTVPMSTQYTESPFPAEETPKKKPAAKKPAGSKKPAVRAKSVKAKKQ